MGSRPRSNTVDRLLYAGAAVLSAAWIGIAIAMAVLWFETTGQ
jgi:hypothetical protein